MRRSVRSARVARSARSAPRTVRAVAAMAKKSVGDLTKEEVEAIQEEDEWDTLVERVSG